MYVLTLKDLGVEGVESGVGKRLSGAGIFKVIVAKRVLTMVWLCLWSHLVGRIRKLSCDAWYRKHPFKAVHNQSLTTSIMLGQPHSPPHFDAKIRDLMKTWYGAVWRSFLPH